MTINEKVAAIKQLISFVLECIPQLISLVKDLVELVREVKNA